MEGYGWRLPFGKRSCSYFKINWEQNIVLRSRVDGFTDLPLNMIHQYKIFKYQKKIIAFYWEFFLSHFVLTFFFHFRKKGTIVPGPFPFLPQICKALDSSCLGYLRRKKKSYFIIIIIITTITITIWETEQALISWFTLQMPYSDGQDKASPKPGTNLGVPYG